MFWLTLSFLISQIFAAIAIVADIISFQFKERKKIIIFFMIAALCIVLHYILLERYAAAVIGSIAIVRFFVSYYKTDIYLIYVFTALLWLVTYFFYKDIYDVIYFIGITFATIGVFQSSDKSLRLWMMWGTVFVMIYDILIFSPVGVLLDFIFFVSNLVWYYRFYYKK